MTSSDGNRQISASSIVAATNDQVSSDIGGETILLSMQSAMYYGLDSVGSRTWELVRVPIRVSDICKVIAEEFDVDSERCEADSLEFLRELAAKGLIEVSGLPKSFDRFLRLSSGDRSLLARSIVLVATARVRSGCCRSMLRGGF